VLLAAADADAERTRRDAEAGSARLRARLNAIEKDALERALALVLPSPEATTCSPR
jgi:hypothetical protein